MLSELASEKIESASPIEIWKLPLEDLSDLVKKAKETIKTEKRNAVGITMFIEPLGTFILRFVALDRLDEHIIAEFMNGKTHLPEDINSEGDFSNFLIKEKIVLGGREAKALYTYLKKAQAALQQDSIFPEIKRVLVEVFKKTEKDILPSTRLEDLGFDSLNDVELAVAIEKVFKNIKISTEDIWRIKTVQDLDNLVSNKRIIAGSPIIVDQGQSPLNHSDIALRGTVPVNDLGGINLSKIKLELKQYITLSEDKKKEAIGTIKTLLCVDALMDKQWYSLAHLYFQEIVLLVKDNIISEIPETDKLIMAARQLKDKGYLTDAQGLQFLELLQAGKPVSQMPFILKHP